MTDRSLSLIVALLALGCCAAPAQAQLARTFVSAEIGNDTNDCNRLTPCRTFQRAHDATLASGEITVLDAGGYGAVAITKAISIINDGVGEAGILVSGGFAGITVDAGAADAVSLRGLTIKGLSTIFGGGTGIQFNSGRSLAVENCAIRTLAGPLPGGVGINFAPTTPSHLAVLNTVIADNQQNAMAIEPHVNAGVSVAVSRLAAYGNLGAAVEVRGNFSPAIVKVTVVDSVVTSNALGFGATTTMATVTLMVLRSVANYNISGLFSVGPTSTILFSQSTVMGNTFGLFIDNGGNVLTYGDNNVNGNGSAESPTGTVGKI